MPDTGWLTGTTAASNSAVGTAAWGFVNDALTQDGSYAEASTTGSEFTEYLDISGYNAGISASATVTGIEMRYRKRMNSSFVYVYDLAVHIVKASGTVSSNLAATVTLWSTSFTDTIYGGSSNLWGLSITPTEANSSSLIARVRANMTGDGSTCRAQVDAVELKFHYTLPAANHDRFFFLFE